MEIILLSIITYILIFIFCYFIYKSKQNMYKKDHSPIPNNSYNKTNYKLYYKPKKYIITLTELKFYNVLFQIAKELDLIVLTQVSLYNIIEPKSTNYKNTAFNKIRSKSIDFVLVNKNDCRIKLCIELDDLTHKRYDRIKRDQFINKLFSDLEIDFLRFKVSNYYDKEALKKRIVESIKEHVY